MKRKPSNEPQGINDDAWYYENRSSIEVILRVYDNNGRYLETGRVRIPWKKIRASMRRCLGAHV